MLKLTFSISSANILNASMMALNQDWRFLEGTGKYTLESWKKKKLFLIIWITEVICLCDRNQNHFLSIFIVKIISNAFL